MTKSEAYYRWLTKKIKKKYGNFDYLLHHLFFKKFYWILDFDENRAKDGMDLRLEWANEINDIHAAECLPPYCNVLEMMVALAIKMEEQMSDSRYGDRTVQWFWQMIISLGLVGQDNDGYDAKMVEKILNRFLERKYKSNGAGGLFTVRRCPNDMRIVDIYHQCAWYLNSI